MPVLILDGYNVIHRLPMLQRELDRSLQAARQALITYCQTRHAKRGDVAHLYIVFDGTAHAGHLPSQRMEGLTVLFTDGKETADDRMLRLIREAPAGSSFIIVSNDTYVYNNARAHGARVMSVEAFAAQGISRRHRTSASDRATNKARLASEVARQITAAYRADLERRRTQGKPPRA